MAILIADNLQYQGRKPLDSRILVDTIADMVALSTSIIYDGILVYNKETSKYYTFDNANTMDVTLGQWRELETGGGNASILIYAQDTEYKEHSLVINENKLYLVTADFTSDSAEATVQASFEADLTAGNLLAVDTDTDTHSLDYQQDTDYYVNQLLIHQSKLYLVVTNFHSDDTEPIPDDSFALDLNAGNIVAVGGSGSGECAKYAQNTPYAADTFVRHGEKLCVVLNNFTSDNTEANIDDSFALDVDNHNLLVIEGGGGSSELTEKIVSNIACGAAPIGTEFAKGMTLTELAKKLLLTEIAPTFTFTSSGSGDKEVGQSVAGSTLKAQITKVGTGTVKRVEFYADSTLLDTQAYVDGTSTYVYVYTSNIESNVKMSAKLYYELSDAVEKNISGSANFNFYHAVFYGAVADLVPSTITTLSKKVQGTKGLTANFTLVDQRSCYAYPSSYGNLVSIKDANNFEYLSSYTMNTMTVDYLNDGTDMVTYNVYVLTDPTTITQFKQIYS